MKRALTSLSIVAALALGACGDDDDATDVATTEPAAAPSDGATGGEETTDDTTDTVDDTSSVPADTTAGDPGSSELEAALISLDDLPEGWTEVPVSDDDGETDPDEGEGTCVEEALDAAGVSIEDDAFTAEREFSQGDFGPFLQASIGEVGDDQAEQALTSLPVAIEGCDGVADPDGTVWTYEPLDVPTIGDESYVVRLATGEGDEQLQAITAFARVGPHLLFIATLAFGAEGPDVDLTLSSLQTMVGRLS